MIPSMSRPANPYDNASCESFMKTLKREEIYANEYRDLDHLLENIEAFIDSTTIGAAYIRRSAIGRRRSSSETSSPGIDSAGSDHEFFQAWGDLSSPM